MSDNDRVKETIGDRAEEFKKVFKKGEEFIQTLLEENKKLRFRLAGLEEEKRGSEEGGDNPLAKLQERITALEEENKRLIDRFKEVEEENKDFAQRYVEVEEENNKLANLYIASYQLHSTLDFREVLNIIVEIVINLIGAEIFAIFLLDEKTSELNPVASEGVDVKQLPIVKLGDGRIGSVAQSGESYIASEIVESLDPLSDEPLVCIPLKIKERVVGIIVLYKLLQQKSEFVDVDYELFTLLAGHAATAIFSSKLYTESERKLTTIQGFINLLTK
jgi:transcriptional regulator with GAF, ATPase, and Fis domain